MSDFKMNWIEEFLPNERELNIFDIGAHNFVDSIGFKHYFPFSNVYAFEPSTRNYNLYSKTAQQYGVKTFRLALSNKDGTSTFYNSKDLGGVEWTASGSLLKPTDKGCERIRFEADEVVNTLTLNTFCKQNEIDHVDIIHMDVQGAEHLVLSGMGDYRPKILFCETCEYENYEGSEDLNKLLDIIHSMGYSIQENLQNDTLFIYE